ncbi:Cytochrome P450 78A5 [Nymphaea thermarum]|nr:Cytochrome P450 78A5 [Nymphaea thermarum]
MTTFSLSCFDQWPSLLFISLLLILLILNFWPYAGGFAWRLAFRSSGRSPPIPGPAGFPFLGSPSLLASPHSHRILARAAAALEATRLMAFSLGHTRLVIASHPDTAREILTGSAFSNRPIKESARRLMFHRAVGFAPSGEHWRRLRRIVATHLFCPRRIAMSEAWRQGCIGELMEGLCKRRERDGVVELRWALQAASLRSVWMTVFGRWVEEEREELVEMVKEGYELLGKLNWGDYFPIRILDLQSIGRRSDELRTKVFTYLRRIVADRKMHNAASGDGGGGDFLSILLRLPDEDRLSDVDMLAVLWEMIFRGTDTVAILMEWVMARMVLHPDIQARAQQEIDLHVGSTREVQDSDLPKLTVLHAIVKEVLRLHPPGPLLSWARLAIHDVHVGKWFVPAGTTAMVNMWAITHDASIWKDPGQFKPDRFLEEDVSIMGSDLRLAPFGSGRRACPGKALGLATVHLWLARLLHHFNWLPSPYADPRRPVDLSEQLRMSLEMKKPLVCQAIRRNSVRF